MAGQRWLDKQSTEDKRRIVEIVSIGTHHVSLDGWWEIRTRRGWAAEPVRRCRCQVGRFTSRYQRLKEASC